MENSRAPAKKFDADFGDWAGEGKHHNTLWSTYFPNSAANHSLARTFISGNCGSLLINPRPEILDCERVKPRQDTARQAKVILHTNTVSKTS